MTALSHLRNEFYLNPCRLPAKEQKKLDAFYDYCMKHRYFNIGYPESFDFDYNDQKRFLDFHLNKR